MVGVGGHVRIWGAVAVALVVATGLLPARVAGAQVAAVPVTGTPTVTPAAPSLGESVAITATATDPTAVIGADVRLDAGAWIPMASGPDGYGSTSADVRAIVGRATSVGAGSQHTCAALTDGSVWCWGTGSRGVLGDGTGLDSRAPVRVAGITSARAVSALDGFTCALVDDGSVWCWGQNTYGQLGDGTTADRSSPVRVAGVANAVDVSVGDMHACAVLHGGAIMCWGYNNTGQLGDTTTQDRSTAVAVDGISTATAVAAGADHTCAILAEGAVSCWGANDAGQLGSSAGSPSSTPVAVSLGGPVAQVRAGFSHTCARLVHASVWCWGSNDVHQLGVDGAAWSDAPVEVPGVLAATIGGGAAHTCAALESGGLVCWGDNSSGQLGDGTTAVRTAPVTVAGLPPVSIAGIGGGQGSTCALGADGTIRCWGDNGTGQLGDGSVTNRVQPVALLGHVATDLAVGTHQVCVRASAAAGTGTPSCVTVPVKNLGPAITGPGVSPARAFYGTSAMVTATAIDPTGVAGAESRIDGGPWKPVAADDGAFDEAAESIRAMAGGAVSLSTGGHSTCAVLRDGMVWCWGLNQYGEAGDITMSVLRQPTVVAGITTAVAVATGWDHTCALLADGTVQCWGNDYFGQLGDGTTGNTEAQGPRAVIGVATAVAITAGNAHTCVLLADATMRCWGGNGSGELGDGTFTGSGTPVDPGLSGVTAVSAGFSHTCAIHGSGALSCWGSNWKGQVGDPRVGDNLPSPLDVAGTGVVTWVGAGFDHTCVAADGGTVRCWGDDSSGQLGAGVGESSAVPVVVAGVPSAVAVAGGAQHACAVTADHALWCWGVNSGGLLGGGTSSGVEPPTLAVGLPGITLVAPGSNHACAIITDAVRCWGGNSGGQLGDGGSTASLTPVETGLAGPLGLGAHEVCIRATDPEGHRSPGTSCATLTIVGPDSVAPIFTTAVTVGARPGAVLPTAAATSPLPVTVSWKADDQATGIGLDHYVLERRTGTGAWVKVTLPSALATSIATTIPSAGTVAFRVTAYDAVGNHRTSATPALAPRLIQQTSTAIRWAGAWSTYRAAALSAGSDRWAKTGGASATYTFTGRAVALVAMKGPGRGSLRIYFDGKLAATLSLARTTVQARLIAWQWAAAVAGRHTVKVVVSGTAGHPRVDVDAFVVVP